MYDIEEHIEEMWERMPERLEIEDHLEHDQAAHDEREAIREAAEQWEYERQLEQWRIEDLVHARKRLLEDPEDGPSPKRQFF